MEARLRIGDLLDVSSVAQVRCSVGTRHECSLRLSERDVRQAQRFCGETSEPARPWHILKVEQLVTSWPACLMAARLEGGRNATGIAANSVSGEHRLECRTRSLEEDNPSLGLICIGE